MKNLFIITILALSFSLFAAPLKAQVNLDSLNQIWLDESQPDTTRFKAMKTIAWYGYLFSKPDTAYILAQKLQALAQKKENKNWEAEAIKIQGISFDFRGNHTEALAHYTQSLQLFEEVNDKIGIANSLNNIGSIYGEKGNLKEALDYFERSLQLREELGDKSGIAYCLDWIGYTYIKHGQYLKAMPYCKRALDLAFEMGEVQRIKDVARNLKRIYKSQNEGMKAMEMFELEIQMHDSIQNDDIKKQIAQTESRAEFEKELLIKQQEEKEAARIVQEEIDKRNTLQFAGIGIGIFALFGLVFF